MAKTRKAIGDRVRFEVFKRDSFTCQYCGKPAPEVILNCDHIIAVANGGDNSITNLVTSCVACNSGKSAVPLSDESAVAKQKRQLDELSERRRQLDMMMQWKMEVLDMKCTEVSHAIAYFEKRFSVSVSSTGRPVIEKVVKRFGITETIEAIDKAFKAYDDPNKAFDKLGGICNVSRKCAEDPVYEIVCRVAGTMRYRGFYIQWRTMEALVRLGVSAGMNPELIRDLVSKAKHWTEWQELMNSEIDSRNAAPSPEEV